MASNTPKTVVSFFNRTEERGRGFGTGKGSLTLVSADFSGMVSRGEMEVTDVTEVYARYRMAAEMAAPKNKPLKVQDAESRKVQENKLKGAAEFVAAGHPLALQSIDWALLHSQTQYVEYCAGVAAAKKATKKTPDISAADLEAVVKAAATPKAKDVTLESTFAQWQKKIDGILEDDNYADEISRVHMRFSGEPLTKLATTVATVVEMLARLRVETTPDPEMK